MDHRFAVPPWSLRKKILPSCHIGYALVPGTYRELAD